MRLVPYLSMALLSMTLVEVGVASADPRELPASSLCAAGDAAEIIQIRVIRPARTFRVEPTPEEIVRDGEAFQVKRGSPIWRRFAQAVCTEAGAVGSEKASFTPRIVVYAEGRPLADAMLIEYPDYNSDEGNVRVALGRRVSRVAKKAPRLLLDFAATRG